MKNTEQLQGFLNRHEVGMPTEKCRISVVTKASGFEPVELCDWEPFDESEHTKKDMPASGYLGTAYTVNGQFRLGFHAWEQNNSEFIYYSIEGK
jgi:hypothetical protein